MSEMPDPNKYLASDEAHKELAEKRAREAAELNTARESHIAELKARNGESVTSEPEPVQTPESDQLAV